MVVVPGCCFRGNSAQGVMPRPMRLFQGTLIAAVSIATVRFSKAVIVVTRSCEVNGLTRNASGD